MLKLDRITLAFLFLLTFTAGASAYALDDAENSGESDLESKATQAHKLAASDMMYQNEEWKAMYYQNQQIIQLLKQVRDSLEVMKSRGAKQDPEEKSVARQ